MNDDALDSDVVSGLPFVVAPRSRGWHLMSTVNRPVFTLTDEELLMEAELQYPWVDPRLWNEAIRRGIAGRLNSILMATPEK